MNSASQTDNPRTTEEVISKRQDRAVNALNPPSISQKLTKVQQALKAVSAGSVLAVSSALTAGALVATAATPSVAQAAVVASDFSDLVEQVTPGVARVNVVTKVSEEELAKAQTVELLRQFFGDRIRIPGAQTPAIEYNYGTGFFVSSDGYLLTNHHVIAGADKITVTLNDRTELDATLVGSDERSDVPE